MVLSTKAQRQLGSEKGEIFMRLRNMGTALAFMTFVASPGTGWSGETENTWIVETVGNEVAASVNGKVTYGDKLRIRFTKENCDYGNTLTTFYTAKGNPDIARLRNVVASARFNDTQINVRILFAMKFLQGHSVWVDMGWNKVAAIKDFFAGKDQVTFAFRETARFKPDDFLDITMNSWPLNGLDTALDKARAACRSLPDLAKKGYERTDLPIRRDMPG
jgi:hypothetical protein